MIDGSIMANIQVFHTSNTILFDSSRFSFIGSIPESMLHNIPATSDVIRAYRSLPACGPRPMTDAVRQVLEVADKLKKGGKKRTKAGRSEPA